MKKLIKKFIPKVALNWYHWLWSFLASLLYGNPSKDMVVIGITGTKGKSTTSYLLAKILEEAGLPVALSSSLMFKIKDKEDINPYHMTMVGRSKMQKFLHDAKKAGCKYMIVEVTSEGIAQNRHKFIDFDVAVFTNLSKEHLETHGGFENYKKTKGMLFDSLMHSKRKNIDGKDVKKIIVANHDDENAEYFLSFDADERYSFGIRKECGIGRVQRCIVPKTTNVEKESSKFALDGTEFNLHIPGEFNIYNALCSVVCAGIFGVDKKTAKEALEKIHEIAGRMQFVKAGQDFTAIVDLAHTPSSFEAVFDSAKKMTKGGKIISVFGSAGGGRDKWKRPELGKIAAKNSEVAIITNEDPYDEAPKEILEDIKKGVLEIGFKGELFVIEDRKEAIQKAVSLAKSDDLLLFLGKGTERTMVLPSGTIPWNEKEVVAEAIKNRNSQKGEHAAFIATLIGLLFIVAIFLGVIKVMTFNTLKESALHPKISLQYQLSDSSLADVSINDAVLHTEVARTDAKKAEGLSGRTELEKDAGMLFVFDTPDIYVFWNKDTYIPLDILWINGNNVVYMLKNMPIYEGGEKYIETPTEKANYVLEVNAGFIDEHNIKIGDKVNIQKIK